MNLIDILLIIVALFSIWLAWEKGFINATADLIVWIGSVLIAFFLYPYIGRLAEKFIDPSPWILPVAFLFSILFSGFLLSLVARSVLQHISPRHGSSRVNHILGILPGLVNAYISTSIVALLLLTVPIADGLSEKAEKSRVATMLTPPAEWLQDKLTPVFDEAIRRSMTKLIVKPGSDETVKLSYTEANTKERPDLEAKMLELVNRERMEKGLKPLVADTALRTVALAHSRDMFARGYFSHYTPERKDPFDRMRLAGIRFRTAGENLALARTVSIAHTGLMNSPGHRANILNPAYGRVGIGIADGGLRGLMVSQEFRN
jgi:uncharacterized protein YkwD